MRYHTIQIDLVRDRSQPARFVIIQCHNRPGSIAISHGSLYSISYSKTVAVAGRALVCTLVFSGAGSLVVVVVNAVVTTGSTGDSTAENVDKKTAFLEFSTTPARTRSVELWFGHIEWIGRPLVIIGVVLHFRRKRPSSNRSCHHFGITS